MYHIGKTIEQNQIPLTIDNADRVYTMKLGKFNRDIKYANGPIKIVTKTTKDAASAKPAISFHPHDYSKNLPYIHRHHLHKKNYDHHMESSLLDLLILLLHRQYLQ